jgi:hypothetical protein
MTTLFDNLNEQLFTDISSEQAELIQGGYAFLGFDSDKREFIAQADSGIPNLKNPNAIDRVYITEGKWQLYDSDNYINPIGDPIGPTSGSGFLLPKGQRDRANSLKRIDKK